MIKHKVLKQSGEHSGIGDDGYTYEVLEKQRKGMWGWFLKTVVPELILERYISREGRIRGHSREQEEKT